MPAGGCIRLHLHAYDAQADKVKFSRASGISPYPRFFMEIREAVTMIWHLQVVDPDFCWGGAITKLGRNRGPRGPSLRPVIGVILVMACMEYGSKP